MQYGVLFLYVIYLLIPVRCQKETEEAQQDADRLQKDLEESQEKNKKLKAQLREQKQRAEELQSLLDEAIKDGPSNPKPHKPVCCLSHVLVITVILSLRFFQSKEPSTRPEPELVEDDEVVEEPESKQRAATKRKVTSPIEEEEVEVPLPPVLVGNALELGATLTPNFKGLLGNRGVWNKFPFSFLKESNVSFGAILLPVPAFTTTFVRSYQPIPGITPFAIAATTTIQRSLGECPPSFQIQATKQITERKVTVLTWSSGLLQWPGFLLEAFPALGLTAESFYASLEESSTLQLALKSFPKSSKSREFSHEGDFDDDEARRLEAEKEDVDRSEEAWDIALALAPGGAGIGLNYSRNLFSGKPMDDPAKSEWSSEGYFPMAKMDEARAVKLEVSSSLHLDGSIGWSVKGTRLISENTRIGLGLGITANNVAMTVTWRRLGQRVNLPVVVMPHRHHDAAALAAVFPWLAYCAVEFGYVRPRNRKLRRQAVARRHKELNKLIPQKRADSEQAIEMMSEQVHRRQAREESHDGLVITKAEYGYYPSQSKKPKSGFTEPRVIDVTIPVAALVDRGQLVISKKTVKVKDNSPVIESLSHC